VLRQLVRRVRKLGWTLRWKLLNHFSRRHQCYICSHRFGSFYPFQRGLASVSAFVKQMQLVGSDVVNFGCPYCHSNDRERHLFLYFDRLKLWDRLRGTSILHFAPERNFSRKIKACEPSRYVKADFFPENLYAQNPEIERVDVTNIHYGAETFEWLICNHVLEHVPDPTKALAEIHRVLKPGGLAVLQTPFSSRLANTLEDPGINTDALRIAVYGQDDHLRLFGRDFVGRLEAASFTLQLCAHDTVATHEEAKRFGMNPQEDLILVKKAGGTSVST
jgi:SAM-dependent methyltransferase